jgi:type IV pilus assembly protein PilB
MSAVNQTSVCVDIDHSVYQDDKSELIPLETFFENLIKRAILERTSDIHLENFREGMRMKTRVDSKLHTIDIINKTLVQAVIAKIRIDANAKIDEARMPQDMRIHIKIADKNYDLRISILPTIYGENIAIRIFGQENNDFDLKSIGLFQGQAALF